MVKGGVDDDSEQHEIKHILFLKVTPNFSKKKVDDIEIKQLNYKVPEWACEVFTTGVDS